MTLKTKPVRFAVSEMNITNNILGNRYGWLVNEKAMWDRLSNMLAGVSWHYAHFAQSGKMRVPQEPGIYLLTIDGETCITCLEKVRLRNVMYIGKTGNLRRRFNEHLRDNEPNPRIQALKKFSHSISFWFCGLRKDRLDEVEKWLIWHFLPAANQDIKIPFVVSVPGLSALCLSGFCDVGWRAKVSTGGQIAYYNYPLSGGTEK